MCGGKDLTKFLELGPQPLANGFLTREMVEAGKEEKFPLDVYVCRGCWHAQLLDVISKETLFTHYLYFSQTTKTTPAHFAELAKEVVEHHTQTGDFVVEIGSNDGVLLRAFEGTKRRILGVEPASNIAEVARKNAIPTMNRFFTPEVAESIARDLGKAKAILSANVVGHIDDLVGLTKSIKSLLTDDGTWIFEVPYLVDLLEKNEFDTVYHEHLSYFALHPAKTMLERGGLALVDVKHFAFHGGTVRIYAKHAGANATPSASVQKMLAEEKRLKLDTVEPYHAHAARVKQLKAELRAMVTDLKRQGKRIVGYGAPAKGNTLLNYVGLTAADLQYCQDTTVAKQGLYTPGTHIPVVPPSEFQREPPDVALMLAWNYEPEILAKESEYRKRGGKFIVPIPMPRLV